MPTGPEQAPDSTLRLATQFIERTVEARALELGQLEELRHVLLNAAERDLRLHRRTLGLIESIGRELDRMQRTLHRLSRARGR